MQPFFHFDSLTNAQSAKQLLNRHGIGAAIRRDPQPDRRRGCGFVIFVPNRTLQAQQILEQHGLLSANARDA